MTTLIVVGVLAFVLVVFVGLVWLFVRLSRPPQPRDPEPGPARGLPATKSRGGSQAGRPRR